MGAEIHKQHFTEADHALFKQRLQAGLSALSSVLARPGFGRGERSIGMELELFLIDARGRPFPISDQVVRAANSPSVTHEMGCFDVELSTRPVALAGRPFSAQREYLFAEIDAIARQAAKFGARVVPISVLPTLQRSDFHPDAITDMPRYRALALGMQRARQSPFRICIDGADPLHLTTDDVAMEAANTAFHVHLRVAPDEFASMFNAAMLMTAPVLAAAGNSPTFLGHRLWHETRIALFKQAGDDRPPDSELGFRMPPRIGFGNGWVREGAAELFAESVALHEPLLAECGTEDPLDVVARGGVPELWELKLHHGTVWTWNRPVYDAGHGGHLRIELRALPAGPTVDDMLANAAFLLGGVLGLAPHMAELLPSLPFSLAERNFYRAAQFGLDARLAWPTAPGGAPESISARRLLRLLMPRVVEGLAQAGVERSESEHYLGLFEARVQSGATGAVWQRETFDALVERGARREWALSELVERYLRNVESGAPVCAWPRGL